jgi:hypothetical protein
MTMPHLLAQVVIIGSGTQTQSPCTHIVEGGQPPQVTTTLQLLAIGPQRPRQVITSIIGVQQVCASQTPPVQSLAPLQVLVSVQGGHAPPPQSMSLSVPFFTASPQVGLLHTLPLHTPLTQSLGPAQCRPSPHGLHGPPQSVSVSPPSFTMSEQPIGTQLAALQSLPGQSASLRH